MTTDSKRQAPSVPQEIYDNLIDAIGLYPTRPSDIQFHVVVTDVRMRWGHTDVLIKPLRGLGSKWVDVTSVQATAERVS